MATVVICDKCHKKEKLKNKRALCRNCFQLNMPELFSAQNEVICELEEHVKALQEHVKHLTEVCEYHAKIHDEINDRITKSIKIKQRLTENKLEEWSSGH